MRGLSIGTKKITDRSEISLEKYLHDIGKIPLIEKEREVILSKKIREGCEESFNELINANLRFVVSVAKQYQNMGMSLSELIQEGNLGLIKAAKKFDATLGYRFISYAVWWIRQQILHSLPAQSRVIKIPLNKATKINMIDSAISRLEQYLHRNPSDEEISEATGINIDDVIFFKGLSSRNISLDSQYEGSGEESFNYMDFLTPATIQEDKFRNKDLSDVLERAIGILNQKEAYILRLFYFHEKSHEEIGKDEFIKKNKETVRQIKNRALRKIKNSKFGLSLREYL